MRGHMKVRDCKKCQFCKRKVWSSTYKPAGYHTIGVSHAYAFCEKHKERVLTIKHCEEGNSATTD